ncbi:hypothetical protein BDQ17DRAFT_1329173 [Cyathus striatus]|nr:hypothetical protein BDQ17DRAFT_1329173 [Cyathus striatus]
MSSTVSDHQFNQFLSALNNLQISVSPSSPLYSIVKSAKDTPRDSTTIPPSPLSQIEPTPTTPTSPSSTETSLKTKLSITPTHVLPACPQQREIYWFITNQLGCDPSPTSSQPHLGEYIQTVASKSSATPLTLFCTLCILKSLNTMKDEIVSGHDVFDQALERAHSDSSSANEKKRRIASVDQAKESDASEKKIVKRVKVSSDSRKKAPRKENRDEKVEDTRSEFDWYCKERERLRNVIPVWRLRAMQCSSTSVFSDGFHHSMTHNTYACVF